MAGIRGGTSALGQARSAELGAQITGHGRSALRFIAEWSSVCPFPAAADNLATNVLSCSSSANSARGPDKAPTSSARERDTLVTGLHVDQVLAQHLGQLAQVPEPPHLGVTPQHLTQIGRERVDSADGRALPGAFGDCRHASPIGPWSAPHAGVPGRIIEDFRDQHGYRRSWLGATGPSISQRLAARGEMSPEPLAASSPPMRCSRTGVPE